MNDEEFVKIPGDGYAIYQLKQDSSTRDLRFASMVQVEKKGRKVDRGNYDLVYTGILQSARTEQAAILEELYARFNLNHPADFTGHSLSMSDIIVLRQSGRVSCHYVDTYGFREVKDFFLDNLLHSAEISMEDDYDMIDGIIGNNGVNPTKEEKKPEKKPEERLPLREQLRLAVEKHNNRMHNEHGSRKAGLER